VCPRREGVCEKNFQFVKERDERKKKGEREKRKEKKSRPRGFRIFARISPTNAQNTILISIHQNLHSAIYIL